MERLEHVVHPWGTKGPSGRSLRGRTAQAQVQVRGYKEEKLELAARTLCFICPSFASCALVRCSFTQCSPLLSLSLSLSTLSASLSPSLLASSSLEPDDPRVREPLRSIVFNPTAQPLDQVGVAFLSSTRRGRDKFLFFAAIVQNDCIR